MFERPVGVRAAPQLLDTGSETEDWCQVFIFTTPVLYYILGNFSLFSLHSLPSSSEYFEMIIIFIPIIF